MKIIIYSLTDKGRQALVREFVEFTGLSVEQQKELSQLFNIKADLDKGMISLTGIDPRLEYVQPWAIKNKIVQSLRQEGAIEFTDFRLVME